MGRVAGEPFPSDPASLDGLLRLQPDAGDVAPAAGRGKIPYSPRIATRAVPARMAKRSTYRRRGR